MSIIVPSLLRAMGSVRFAAGHPVLEWGISCGPVDRTVAGQPHGDLTIVLSQPLTEGEGLVIATQAGNPAAFVPGASLAGVLYVNPVTFKGTLNLQSWDQLFAFADIPFDFMVYARH